MWNAAHFPRAGKTKRPKAVNPFPKGGGLTSKPQHRPPMASAPRPAPSHLTGLTHTVKPKQLRGGYGYKRTGL